MQKFFKLAPWFAATLISWSVGFVYNVYYGGELSWLRRMYEQKIALAEQLKAPRRLLIIGGSGVHYATNSELIEQGIGIPVLNLGLDGPVGLNVILPSVLEQVRPGDIVLFIPEDLILGDDDGLLERSTPFGIAIGRPGLGGVPPKQLAQEFWRLGVPSLRALTKSSLDIIQKGKMTGYYSTPVTERGDPTVTRQRQSKWWDRPINRPISEHAIKRITQFREEVQARGATLVLSLPWVYATTDDQSLANMSKIAEELAKIAPLLYDQESFNLKTDSSWFADTHHHLLPETRNMRARELVEQLKPILE